MTPSALRLPLVRRAAAAAALLLAALAALATQVESLGRAAWLDYTPIEVLKLRLFGSVDVYVETSLQTSDAVNALVLGTIAGAAAVAFALLLRHGGAAAARDRLWFGLLTAGAGWLSLDELLSLHETIGHNLRFLAGLPLVHHPDDLVVGAYLLVAVATCWRFRDVFLSSRATVGLLGVAFGLFGAAAALDLVTSIMLEEGLEVLASLALLGAFVALAVERVGPALLSGARPGALRAVVPADPADRLRLGELMNAGVRSR